MPEKRRFKPRQRLSGVRDPKLIIIATEGACTEGIYFEDLASAAYCYNPRVHVEILRREETRSAPEDVLQSLDDFYRQYRLKAQDELWIVLDRDRWGDAKLGQIAKLCDQKGYAMAVSHPCFELWLLLHLKALDEYPVETLDEFRENRKAGSRTRLEHELVVLLGEYNKAAPRTEHFLPYVAAAIERARELDIHPEDRWPQDLGTRVYLLAEHIMDREPRVA